MSDWDDPDDDPQDDADEPVDHQLARGCCIAALVALGFFGGAYLFSVWQPWK